jgi:nucleoid DNA-binding protein
MSWHSNVCDEIYDLLELSGIRHRAKSHFLVRTIVSVMKDALLRGEEVRIWGLGDFTFRDIPPKNAKNVIVASNGLDKVTFKDVIIPAHKRIHFRPCARILKNLNQKGTPNVQS